MSQVGPKVNNAEKRVFENLMRVLKDRKERDNFFKLLKLYFDGVLSLKDYHMLYTIKYSAKLKQEARDEFEKLLPSRNTNRRALSALLRSWNDLDGRCIEKVSPIASYYKMVEDFPLPTCTAKLREAIYKDNLNDRYLCIGTEKAENTTNHKIVNQFSEKLFQNEDKLYEKDT